MCQIFVEAMNIHVCKTETEKKHTEINKQKKIYQIAPFIYIN